MIHDVATVDRRVDVVEIAQVPEPFVDAERLQERPRSAPQRPRFDAVRQELLDEIRAQKTAAARYQRSHSNT